MFNTNKSQFNASNIFFSVATITEENKLFIFNQLLNSFEQALVKATDLKNRFNVTIKSGDSDFDVDVISSGKEPRIVLNSRFFIHDSGDIKAASNITFKGRLKDLSLPVSSVIGTKIILNIIVSITGGHGVDETGEFVKKLSKLVD